MGQYSAEKQSHRTDMVQPVHRARNQVERFFNRIEQCRRAATRYDRLAGHYLAFVQLASIRLWLAARFSPRPSDGWEKLAIRWRVHSALTECGVRRHYGAQMSSRLNEGIIGDTAKLMMHRLIVRKLHRDPSLLEKAKVAHARQADQFAGWPFVSEWQDLLALPLGQLATRLVSRERDMVRLRITSPFWLIKDIDLGDYNVRIRIRRAARRIVGRGVLAHVPPVVGKHEGSRPSDAALSMTSSD